MAGERRLPGNGFWGFWTLGTGGWKDGVDENFLRLSVLVQGAVRSRSTALPGNAPNGFIAIVPDTASAHANQIAVRDEGAWTYLAPGAGVRLFVEDTKTFAYFDGASWFEEAAGEVSTFLTLDDVPDSYGTAGQFLAVNALGTGLTWVDAPAGGGGGGGGIEEAPQDGVFYGRKDGVWVPQPQGTKGPFLGALARFNADKAWSGSIQPVVWDATDYDIGGFWTDAARGRFTVPEGVQFIRLHATIEPAAGMGGNVSRDLRFAKNESSVFRGSAALSVQTGYTLGATSISSPPVPVVAGDFFEVRHNTTATASVTYRAATCLFAIEAI